MAEAKFFDLRDGAPTDDFEGVTNSHDNNEWGNGEDWKFDEATDEATGQTAAVEALWGAQRTWDMLLNTLNLEGFNGKAGPFRLGVHYRQDAGTPYGDANFDGRYSNFGDGETSETWSWTNLAFVGHELGHGIWHHNVSQDNEGEARGLNEGHGDITGTLAKHYAYLADGAGSPLPTHERGNMDYF